MRFLSDEELGRLGGALRVSEQLGEHPSTTAAVKLLLLTGCRRGEILKLTWEEVDLDRRCLRLSDSKSGRKLVPLGAAAVVLLEQLPRLDGNPYVLPGTVANKHFVGLEKAWQRIRRRAGLDDVRLHDLRHNFASIAAGMGESLVVIGSLLGHADTASTARYAHLAPNPRQAAANRIAERLEAAIQ